MGQQRTNMTLPAYLPCLSNINSNSTTDRDHLVVSYFHQGYSNIEIISFLAVQHAIFISLSTVKRILQRLGLRRRHPSGSEDKEEIKSLISNELAGSGSYLGK